MLAAYPLHLFKCLSVVWENRMHRGGNRKRKHVPAKASRVTNKLKGFNYFRLVNTWKKPFSSQQRRKTGRYQALSPRSNERAESIRFCSTIPSWHEKVFLAGYVSFPTGNMYIRFHCDFVSGNYVIPFSSKFNYKQLPAIGLRTIYLEHCNASISFTQNVCLQDIRGCTFGTCTQNFSIDQ